MGILFTCLTCFYSLLQLVALQQRFDEERNKRAELEQSIIDLNLQHDAEMSAWEDRARRMIDITKAKQAEHAEQLSQLQEDCHKWKARSASLQDRCDRIESSCGLSACTNLSSCFALSSTKQRCAHWRSRRCCAKSTSCHLLSMRCHGSCNRQEWLSMPSETISIKSV